MLASEERTPTFRLISLANPHRAGTRKVTQPSSLAMPSRKINIQWASPFCPRQTGRPTVPAGATDSSRFPKNCASKKSEPWEDAFSGLLADDLTFTAGMAPLAHRRNLGHPNSGRCRSSLGENFRRTPLALLTG